MAELKITAANFENEYCIPTSPSCWISMRTGADRAKCSLPYCMSLPKKKSGTLKVGKVNVDEQMELSMRFQVSSIPMLVVFKDGKAVAKSVGYRPKSEIAAMVEGVK